MLLRFGRTKGINSRITYRRCKEGDYPSWFIVRADRDRASRCRRGLVKKELRRGGRTNSFCFLPTGGAPNRKGGGLGHLRGRIQRAAKPKSSGQGERAQKIKQGDRGGTWKWRGGTRKNQPAWRGFEGRLKEPGVEQKALVGRGRCPGNKGASKRTILAEAGRNCKRQVVAQAKKKLATARVTQLPDHFNRR